MKAFHLKSNVATQELKSLDRFWHQQWSMLFNSMIHEKPYRGLYNFIVTGIARLFSVNVVKLCFLTWN